MTEKLAVILPIFNEISAEGFLPKILTALSQGKNLEVCFVDGGSQDETQIFCENFFKNYPDGKFKETFKKKTQKNNLIFHWVLENRNLSFQYFDIGSSTRGKRLDFGIQKSRNSLIFLHHPRSLISAESLEALRQKKPNFWGGFTHKFEASDFRLRFTSWYSNNIRGRRIIYLDHGIFAPRAFFEKIGGAPDISIFEDTKISETLGQFFGPPHILPFISKTSSIRFRKNGFWNQAWRNQICKIQYFWGQNTKNINKKYEKKLPLNEKNND